MHVADDVVTDPNIAESGIDATLEEAGSVSGAMTTAAGDPAEGRVTAYTLGGAGRTFAKSGTTGPNGSYSLAGLRAGSYLIEFVEDATGRVEYWQDTADANLATLVAVEAGQASADISASMDDKTLPDPVVTPPVVTPPIVIPPVVTPPVVPLPPTDVDSSHKPKVKGKAKVGATLKAKVSYWIPAAATVKYQWLVNGKPIKKATKAKLKLTKKLRGKKISVRVVATSAGHLPATTVAKAGRVRG